MVPTGLTFDEYVDLKVRPRVSWQDGPAEGLAQPLALGHGVVMPGAAGGPEGPGLWPVACTLEPGTGLPGRAGEI